MNSLPPLDLILTLMPPALMLLAALFTPISRVSRLGTATPARLWTLLYGLSTLALIAAVLALIWPWVSTADARPQALPWLLSTSLGAVLAVLVQCLGTVIAAFSGRYLQGEAQQPRYIAALAATLAAVQTLLLADHWLLLIAAWAWVGVALERLLCFYADRPFALLAAHKKRLADRLADGLLLAAAALAWLTVGNGSLSDLTTHVAAQGMSLPLQISAALLVLAVVLRTALLPVHGWLIQVMEAPTPVSALLHAGVVNLGGFVLIRFAPLLEHALVARWMLVVFGLATALLAGLVMLTRISIKVRLAWSTVAQMGFMVLECGLGLYTLAALHLIGHSLYKAHAFLAASEAVRQTRLLKLREAGGSGTPGAGSLWLAPVFSVATVLLVQSIWPTAAWPVWWSVVMGLAWAPLLWLPAWQHLPLAAALVQGLRGLALVVSLSAVAHLAHALPWGLSDAPLAPMGWVAALGMGALYLCLTLLHLRPAALATWRRWSYAGFYLDEITTRLTLWAWPTSWTPEARLDPRPRAPSAAALSTPR